ncbi:hypothetical protein G6F56_011434 [Rhizopus delemar]|nr:hypothetical protein G6F56_011434 [Rhizopus delemar]
MTISEIVYAIHDFEAENEDELNFCTGEPIVIIQKDDGFDDGWWKGKNTKGEEGLFPMNYISYQSCHHQLPTPSNSSNRKPVDSISSEERPPVSSAQLKKSVIQSLLHPELKSTSPEYWDINQVETWLNVIDFGSIAESFKTQEITGDILLELTMGSLKELDVPTFGKRFKLQTAINVLREEYCLPQNLPISNTYYSINKKPTNQYKRQSIYLQEEKEINFMTSDNKKRADLPQHLDELKNISFPSNQPAVLPIDHGYSRTEDDTAPQIEGWLHKQGCKYRTWNKRWFVLKGPNLFYFKSPKV